MSAPITGLEWPVASGGYRWVKATSRAVLPVGRLRYSALSQESATFDGQHVEGWFLTSGRAVDSTDVKRRSYSLFDDCPSLFQEFLRTDVSRAAVQAFANRYGLLGAPRQFLISVSGTASDELCAAELFEDWKAEIQAMSTAATAWERLQASANRPYARPLTPFPPFQRSQLDTALFQMHSAEIAQLVDISEKHDTTTGTIAYIQLLVNLRMDGLSPRLFWSQDTAHYQWNVVPKSLLAGLWFEFAESISRRANFSRCENCDRWFEISDALGGSRKRKRFCRDLCRVQAHRKRGALSANTSRKKAAPQRRNR